MPKFEVELGQITESRDARSQELFEVTVDIYVQKATGSDSVSDSVDHEVTFVIEDEEAAFKSITGPSECCQLSLIAIKAAANELEALQENYTVNDPIATTNNVEYDVIN